ncbi:diguanylate cyclase [Terasakiella sp. A23]|uniref:sensor domain-containing diguanylate cyclase n=1 Tax=Terasakiella sp. FCG-A23 TaxID=3080561 RepID=UPI002955AFD8|nr:diguanylate cyclase [Terasakiella sp. A23]MDV7341331.1 diguanylate cyclase [Terasakiella sp. A23]
MKQNKLRFIIVLAALMIFGFMMTSLTSYYAAHDSLSEQISETALPLTSNNIYSEIQRDLLQPIFISSLMAQDTFVRDWTLQGENDPGRLVKYLREIQNRYNTVTSFFVSEQTKKYYHSTGILKTISDIDPLDDWYYKFVNSGEEYEINLDFDTANPSSLTVFINYRVYDYAGNFIGVTGVGLSVSKVQQRIVTYQKRYGRRVSFIDRDGTIMLSNTDDYRGSSIRKTPGLDKIATNILSQPSGSFSYERDGKLIYLNSRLVDEFQWYLLVEQEEDSVKAKITDNLMVNLFVSLVISIVVILIANLTISRYQRKLEDMATTDKLTGVPNRNVFDPIFDQISKSAKRHHHPVSVAMLDVDHFKKINDTHGHLCGDVVLKDIAKIIQERLRESDTVCRWGGEEFLILLPECDDARAIKIAEDIRKSIENRTIMHGNLDLKVTASLGVTQMMPEEAALPLINRADQALYQSKRTGRNKVSITYPSPS